MFWVIVGLVLLLAIVLIIMVLLQPSKSGGSLGGAFGGLGASLGSTFGSRRTLDFLAKGTTYVAAALAALCLLANIFFVPTVETTNNPVTTGARGTAPAPPPMLPQGGAPQGGATQGGGAQQGAQPAPSSGQPAPSTQPSQPAQGGPSNP